MRPIRAVSVIIPCYKQAHFLAEAIESVLRQTHPAEIIVIDDGSPDNASEVAAGYCGVQCIRQPNSGLGAARNLGVHVSTGEYLVFLDADDRLLPNAVEIGVKSLNGNPDCAFVWGQCRHVNQQGTLIASRRKPYIDGQYYARLLRENYITTCGVVMYRRAAFDRIGLFDLSWGAEDYDFHLRVTRQLSVYCHNQLVLEYRIHPSSMTQKSARMLKATLATLSRQYEFVKHHKEYEPSYKAGMRAWRNMYGDRLWQEMGAHLGARRQDWPTALHCLWTLMRYDPSRFVHRAAARLYASAVRSRIAAPRSASL